MVELEHLDETRQEAVERTCTRQWNMVLWAQQNHKIKIVFMGDIVLWFSKDRKKHIGKFFKGWFGPYKIKYFLPTNIVLLVNIDKFKPNPILVNINRLKLYKYLGKAPRGLEATIEGGGEHKEYLENKEEDSQKGF
jgi:hypothetical protein